MKKLSFTLVLMSIIMIFSLVSCLPDNPPADPCAEGHIWGDYTVITEASCTAAGKQSRVCSVCGEAEEAELPMLDHTYGTEFEHDESNHWNECSCGVKANVAAHSLGDWVVVTEPTYTEKGLKKQSCECGYYVEQEIDTLVPTTGIELNKSSATLVLNGSTEASMVELIATVLPENAENKNYRLESTNEEVAIVINGKVYAMGLGSCEIKAISEQGEFVASCQITVINEPESVSLSGGGSVILNGTLNLTATVLPADAADKTVVWTSSNESILKVEGGVVTAVGAGKATITVTTANGKSASLEISVIEANIDANLNDSIYNGINPYYWALNGYKDSTGKTHNVAQQVKIYFGEDGLYISIDVDDAHVQEYANARLETFLMLGDTPTTTNTYQIRFYMNSNQYTYRFYSFGGDTSKWNWNEKTSSSSIIYSKAIDEAGYVVEAFVPYSDLGLNEKPENVNYMSVLAHMPEGAGSGEHMNYGTYDNLFVVYKSLQEYDVKNYIQYNANGVVFKQITVDGNFSLDETNLTSDRKYETTFTVDYLYGLHHVLGATFTGTGAEYISEVGNGVYKLSIPEANVTDFAHAQTIKVTASGLEKEIAIKVTPEVLPSSVEISGGKSVLKVGETLNLTAAVLPENATNKAVVWASSNEGVLKVEGGVVTAVGNGKATITVTTANGKSASITISVIEAEIDANLNDSIYDGINPYFWALDGYKDSHGKTHNISNKTKIYFGEDGLYIAIVVEDADAHNYADARFETYLMLGDTPTTTNTYQIRFYVNNAQYSYRFYSFGGNTSAWSWNEKTSTSSIVYSKSIDETGYTIEAFLPYSDLGLNAKPESVNYLMALAHRPEGAGSGNYMNYGTYDNIYKEYATTDAYNVNNHIQYNANGVVYKNLTVEGNFILDATNVVANGNYETTFTLDLLYGLHPALGATFTGNSAEFISEVGNGVYKLSIPAANVDGFANGQVIKIACAGFEKEITVSVVAEVLPSSVEISGANDAVLKIGDELTLLATLLPENAFNPNVVWTSSDDTIATVVNGVVTALKEGVVTITAASERDDTICDSYTIVVLDPTVDMNFDNNQDRLENIGSDSSITANSNKLNSTNSSTSFVDDLSVTTGSNGSGNALQINHNTGVYPVMNKKLGTGDFTITFNFNINGQNTGSGSGKYLFGTVQPDGTDGFSFVLRNNTIRFRNDNETKFVTVTLPSDDKTWHNITLTRSGTALTLYYDGASVGSFTIAADKSYGTVAFGAYYGQGNWGYLNQTFFLDDLMFFDKALTADEISAKNFAELAPTVKMTFDNAANRLENTGSDKSITAVAKKLNSTNSSTSFVDYLNVTTGANGSGNALQVNHNTGVYPVMSNKLGTGDFTISFNFNINGQNTGSGSGKYLFGTTQPDGTDGFSVVLRNNMIRFRYDNTSDFPAIALPATDTVWHNLTLTRKGTTLTLYYDGALVKSYTIAADKSYGSVAFGAYYGQGNWGYLNQTFFLDDLMFFNRALTTEEVLAVANRYE